jgi:hypothetical protein
LIYQLVVLFYYGRQMKKGVGPTADDSKYIPTSDDHRVLGDKLV